MGGFAPVAGVPPALSAPSVPAGGLQPPRGRLLPSDVSAFCDFQRHFACWLEPFRILFSGGALSASLPLWCAAAPVHSVARPLPPAPVLLTRQPTEGLCDWVERGSAALRPGWAC